MTFVISNLRDCRQFQQIVANRIWNAWWKSDGHSAEEITDAIAKIVDATDFPFALVAHRNEEYLGHILGIVSDLDNRPDLTPWIAALWVDPLHRRNGVATRLLLSAEQQFSKLGRSTIYLCATEEKCGYYLARRWELIGREADIPALDFFEKTLTQPA